MHVRVAGRVVHELRREDEAVHVPGEATFAIAKPPPSEELLRRNALAAGDAPRVGEHALDGVNTVLLEELARAIERPVNHAPPS